MNRRINRQIARRIAGGFTLIELLVTVAIVLSLVGMAIPSIQSIFDKANKASCAQNLRQIGLAAQLYAADHDQDFPTIECWPSDPIYTADDNADTLLGAFADYGLTAAALKCREDVSGPNYFAQEGSSYQWCPMASGVKLTAPKLNFGGGGRGPGGNGTVQLSQLLLAFDYDAVHNHSSNVVFADGHVE